MTRDLFNVQFRRVGGLRFLKLGRLTVSWSVSREYRPLKGTAARDAHDLIAASIRQSGDRSQPMTRGGLVVR